MSTEQMKPNCLNNHCLNIEKLLREKNIFLNQMPVYFVRIPFVKCLERLLHDSWLLICQLQEFSEAYNNVFLIQCFIELLIMLSVLYRSVARDKKKGTLEKAFAICNKFFWFCLQWSVLHLFWELVSVKIT